VFGQDKIEKEGDLLELAVDPSQAPRVSRELVQAGLAVHSLGWHEKSLEEIFFEMTAAPSGEAR
jgi:ABC-2 type transport system ATP-binding protein